jgi:hypothetical protein
MTYPTRDELIARARAAGEPDLCALRFDLEWAETDLRDHNRECDHQKIEMNCATCRLDRATWRYRDAWRYHFGAGVALEIKPLTFDRLRSLYASAVKDQETWLIGLDRWPSVREYIEKGLRADVIGRAMQKILDDEADARKQRHVERANGVVRIHRRRKPRVRSL